jgi:predicted dehydrogenase
MSYSKIRCAVVGLGMGRNHAKSYHLNPEAELVAVADLNREALQGWEEAVGSDRVFTDYEEMLKAFKPDLVSIALPNALHREATEAALGAGAHVLCEKPMAMNLEEAQRMIEAAERANRQLAINFSFRFTPQAAGLKALADTGFLGEVYHANTRWTRRNGFPRFGGWFGQQALAGGGPLIDLGVHRLDLAIWLMGSPLPVSVSGATHEKVGVPRARREGKQFDVEDFATGFIRFDNGASLIFETSWAGMLEKREDMSTQVLGTLGAFKHYNSAEDSSFVAEYITKKAGQLAKGTLLEYPELTRNPYEEMVDCIQGNRPFPVTAMEGLRIQQILDALYASAKTGREVEVKAI